MEVKGTTIAEVWSQSITKLLSEGKWVPTDRGLRALELCNMQLHVTEPLTQPRTPAHYPFPTKFIEEYANSLISEVVSTESVYNRLYSFGSKGLDQVSAVCDQLISSWSSRRAVLTTWDPAVDSQNTHPPCTIYLQLLVREEKLNLTTVLRSNDAWLAAPVDMLALTNLQSHIANKLKIDVGSYSQLSVSYHLYEMDYLTASNFCKVGTP